MNVDLPDPLFLIISLSLLALVPFIAVMATSFVKIAASYFPTTPTDAMSRKAPKSVSASDALS